MNVIKGKIYVGVVSWEKDGNQGYTIYRLEPNTYSKKVIFSNINDEMPDSFTCGDNIITKIIKPIKNGIVEEKIIIINSDTGKTETLVKNKFKSSDRHKVDGTIFMGMAFHVNFNKNGFLYSMSKFKNTTLEEPGYENTVYYYSIKDRKKTKLFNTKYPVSCVSGDQNIIGILSDQHDFEGGGDLYLKDKNGYTKLKDLKFDGIKSCKRINENIYYIKDDNSSWFIDIKKHIYAGVKTSYKETGTVVKNSRVITSKIKDGRFYLTEYKIKDN